MSGDVRERVRARIVAAAPQPISTPAPGDSLIDDLAFDSLSLLELVAGLEREFSLEPLSEDQALDVETVGQVEDLVLALLEQQGGES